MKLHLPQALRTALFACMCSFVTVASFATAADLSLSESSVIDSSNVSEYSGNNNLSITTPEGAQTPTEVRVTTGGGNGFVGGNVSVGSNATLTLAGADSIGYTGGDPTDSISLTGSEGEWATLALDGRQTLSTNIYLNGNARITDVATGDNRGSLNPFGGTITATGTNNVISAGITLRQNLTFDGSGDVSITGLIWQRGDQTAEAGTITKQGSGTLTFDAVADGVRTDAGTAYDWGTNSWVDAVSTINTLKGLNVEAGKVVIARDMTIGALTVASDASFSNNAQLTLTGTSALGNVVNTGTLIINENTTVGRYDVTGGVLGTIEVAKDKTITIGNVVAVNKAQIWEFMRTGSGEGKIIIDGNFDASNDYYFDGVNEIIGNYVITGSLQVNNWVNNTSAWAETTGSHAMTTKIAEGSSLHVQGADNVFSDGGTSFGAAYFNAKQTVQVAGALTVDNTLAFGNKNGESQYYGKLEIIGGTVTADKLYFYTGSDETYTSGVELTNGGALYLGVGGIGAASGKVPTIKLTHGTLGVKEGATGWSTALDVTLGGAAGSSLTIAEGANISFDGAAVFAGTVANHGSLVFGGTISATESGLISEYVASDTSSNGFVGSSIRFYLTQGNGGSVDITNATSTITGLTADEAGSLYYTKEDSSNSYYVQAADATYSSATDEGSIGTATSIVVQNSKTLNVTVGTNPGDNVAIRVQDGGTLAFNGSSNSGYEGKGSLVLAGGTLKVSTTRFGGNVNGSWVEGAVVSLVDGTSNTISGNDAAFFAKVQGQGNLTMSGAYNVYSTIEHTGNLTFENGVKLGNTGWGGAASVNNTGNVTFSGTSSELNGSDTNKTSITNSGNVTVNSGATVTANNATIANSGDVIVSGNLQMKSGSGIANYGKVKVTSGSLTVDSGATFSAKELLVSGGSVSSAVALTLDKLTVEDGASLSVTAAEGVVVGNGDSLSVSADATLNLTALEFAGGAKLILGSGALDFSAVESIVFRADPTTEATGAAMTMAFDPELDVDESIVNYSYATIDVSGYANNSSLLATDSTQTALFTGVDSAAWTGENERVWITFGDDHIDNGLYNLALNEAGNVFIASRVVPEPATATLSLLALTALAARRRRK